MDTKYIYGRDRWKDGQKGLNDRWIPRIYIYMEVIDGQMDRKYRWIEWIYEQKQYKDRRDRWIERID